MSRLRNRHNAKTTTTEKTNPITGTRTTTRTTKTQGHHAHSTGGGPVASTTTTGTAQHAHHKRKPTIGDKVSGAMMKLKGTITRKPGVKAAGTRRMHGTDGKGSHHAATTAVARY